MLSILLLFFIISFFIVSSNHFQRILILKNNPYGTLLKDIKFHNKLFQFKGFNNSPTTSLPTIKNKYISDENNYVISCVYSTKMLIINIDILCLWIFDNNMKLLDIVIYKDYDSF